MDIHILFHFVLGYITGNIAAFQSMLVAFSYVILVQCLRNVWYIKSYSGLLEAFLVASVRINLTAIVAALIPTHP